MPTNLPIEYHLAERRYDDAKTPKEKIKAIEEILATIPKHKGTNNLRMTYKKRLAKLKETLEKVAGKSGGPSIAVKKDGAAQVGIISLPNAGKSHLLNVLTNLDTPVADYPYTTLDPVVGMLHFNKVRIQLVEIPAFSEDMVYSERGPTLLGLARNTDLLILLVDLTSNVVESLQILIDELKQSNIYVLEKPPPVKWEFLQIGGINIIGEEFIEGNISEIKSTLHSKKIMNASLKVTASCTVEIIEQSLSAKNKYMDAVVVGTKGDCAGSKDHFLLLKEFIKKRLPVIPVSSEKTQNIDSLKEEIFKALKITRIFTKSPGKPPEENPIVIRGETSVEKVTERIHKDFLKRFRFARVWGSSKFEGQKVGLDFPLEDGDIVEIHVSR